ncbi:hypothetical protein D9613_009184 [Agrocybe pediades]|uniref:Uncharacterized protein n=1 Tax=Agrocybe pediades TaxID=84607 RepID=A0A8H4R510_9AGAR|nr:hypothetical protein D9613_009184 [Agrocybe pediades]
MFSDAAPDPILFLDGGPGAGVTQLQYNPLRPHILYASYRGSASDCIYSWDVRSNVDEPLEIFKKSSTIGSEPRSNQKIRFDVDITGRYLSVGDHMGFISVFELESGEGGISSNAVPETDAPGPKMHTAKLHFKAHSDSVGSVAFHPLKPSLLSASGSRHFTEIGQSDSSGTESDEESALSRAKQAQRSTKRPQPVTFDSTIKMWDFK